MSKAEDWMRRAEVIVVIAAGVIALVAYVVSRVWGT
jgi:hypothetical protein